jgi:hypothetical protein
MDEDFATFLATLVRQAPLYLVLLGGVVFSIARYERQPAAAIWAVLGCGWLLLFGLFGDAWREFHVSELIIPDAVADIPGPGLDWLADALSCAFFSAIQSLGVVFLLIAVFAGGGWRRNPYRTVEDDDGGRRP